MSYVTCHEAGHPPKIAAKLKKPAYGMTDAPKRWWNILDKALRSCGMVPTRADRCCYVLYSIQSRERAWEHWIQGAIAQQNGTKDAFTESCERSERKLHLERRWIPQLEVQQHENPWQESSISLWMIFWNRWKRNGRTCSDRT